MKLIALAGVLLVGGGGGGSKADFYLTGVFEISEIALLERVVRGIITNGSP